LEAKYVFMSISAMPWARQLENYVLTWIKISAFLELLHSVALKRVSLAQQDDLILEKKSIIRQKYLYFLTQ